MNTEAGNPQGSADTQVTAPTEGTETEKPLSLRDELDARMDAAEKGEQAPDLSAAARALAGARKGGKAAPAAGTTVEVKPKPDQPKLDGKQALPEGDKKPETAPADAVEAPAHWPAADREMFAKQAPEAKTWLLNRHKAMEADYTKKTQELGTWKREKDEIDDAFKNHRQRMDLTGVTTAAAVKQLVAQHEFATQRPQEFLPWFCDQHGIDLKAYTEGRAAADPAGESPTVKALRTQVEQLTGQIQQFSGAQTEQQMNARITEVTQFAEEKDAQGQLLRPYFDEVAPEVSALLKMKPGPKTQKDLQDAYDRAVYANPTTRDKVLAAKDAQRRAKEDGERKAKADAARRAGFDVKGEGAATTGAATTSTLRESLERHFDAAEGRV